MTSGASRGQVFTPNRRPMKKRMAPGTSRGTQRDPKNRLKIDLLLKKGVPNMDFCCFFRARLFLVLWTRFFIKFRRKIDEKSMKKSMHFFIAVLVFMSMATLTKHRILQCESYFSIFRVFVFFLKKRRKMTPKCKEQFCITKSPKNGPRGPILAPKLDPN